MKIGRILFLVSLVAAAVLVAVLARKPQKGPVEGKKEALVIYCAAGIKPPVEAVAKAYEQAYGVQIQLQYGGSGTLLSGLQVAKRGDLFIAGDQSFLVNGRTNGLVDEIVPLAHMAPVIAVPKGNPKGIRGLDDLLRVSVALGNPDATAVGTAVREALKKTGQWEALEKKVKVFKPTVGDIANDIKLGAVDAGIVWDATVGQYPELEMVRVPILDAKEQKLAVGVLKFAQNPAAALHFARYLGAPDKGLKEFAKSGYLPVQGDAWAETPQVLLYSGGVNRLAVEKILDQFERREGAKITRVYNGCGILVSQMKAGQRPDAYFACDTSFLPPVQDFFLDPLNVSETSIVLLVAKGNPLGLKGLEDLQRPGLKVGVANPEQSALGALTERLLKELGLLDKISPNYKVQTPTADLLVNQIRTGSLDVAVVYEVNTSQVKDTMTVVPLSHPLAKAVQPYTLGRNSRHRLLLERLLATICSEESRKEYEKLGFHWRATQK